MSKGADKALVAGLPDWTTGLIRSPDSPAGRVVASSQEQAAGLTAIGRHSFFPPG